MRSSLAAAVLWCMFVRASALPGLGQNPSRDFKLKIDAVVSAAYQSATERFPCKLKAHGKPKMLSWQDVEKCLYDAYDQVDWQDLSQQLQRIRDNGRFQAIDIAYAVESSLTAHALAYNKVFIVNEPEALLPLSNSLLRFLPTDSLLDLPVYSRTGTKIGTFSGVYSFEKVGQISGARNQQSLFQYKDSNGNVQASPGKLLLDSFGVPWQGANSQPGFRLPSDKLLPKHF